MKKILISPVLRYALVGMLLLILGDRLVDRSISRSPAAGSVGCASAQDEIHGAAERIHSCADCANVRHRVTGADEYNPEESSMPPDVGPEDLNQLKSLGIWIASQKLDEGQLAEGLAIARKRESIVRKLIRENPDLVYQHALGQDEWNRLPEELKPLVERQFHGSGSYQVARDCESDKVWRNLTMDDFSTATSAVSPRLANVDDFSGMMKGVVLGNEAGVVAFEGESSAPAEAAGAEPPISAAPPTDYNVLWLNIKYSDEAYGPTGSGMPGAKTSFTTFSYGRVNIVYSVASVSIAAVSTALPSDSTIRSQAQAEAVAQGYTISNYQTIIYRQSKLGQYASLSNNVGYVMVSKNNTNTIVHEIAHNMGVHHANSWKTNTGEPSWGAGVNTLYGELWDAMGLDNPRDDFNVPEKAQLGWLDLNTDYVQDVGSGIYRIYDYRSNDRSAFSTNGVNGAYFGVSVFKDTALENGGAGPRRYMLSYRDRTNVGTDVITEGLYLHWPRWTYNGSSGYNVNGPYGSNFIDTHPTTNNIKDAPLAIGETYVDNDPGNRDGDIYITVLKKTDPDGTPQTGDESLDVKVVVGDQSGNNPPTATLSFTKSTVAPLEPATMTVTAADLDGDTLAYHWDFGLGSTVDALNSMPLNGASSQQFAYAAEGTYTVKCTVSDCRGGTLQVSGTITVSNSAPVTNSVSYEGNGADSGSVPTDPASPYAASSTVTVLDNSGGLLKSGYLFAGWNTSADGSGHSYQAGNTFTITTNTTLYAQWSMVNLTPSVTYDDNGADSGSVPSDGNSPYSSGATVTVLGNTGGMVKSGYSFSGWTTNADGSGNTYQAGETFSITSNTTLYAKWIGNSYIVTFDANGGNSPSPASKQVTYGSTYGSLATTSRSGHTFVGWFTELIGGSQVLAETNVNATENHTLYAKWNVHPTVDPIANRTIELQETPGTGGSSVVLASLDEESEGWVTQSGISVTLDQFSWRSIGTSDDGTFGSAFTGAATGGTGALRSTKATEFPQFTFTNNTGQDVVFDKIHFDLQDLVIGASTFTLTYTSGDLGIADGTVITSVSPTANTSAAADFPDYDIALTGLSDFTLANGHSASFEFSSNTPTEQFLLDNIAFSGTIGNGTVLSATTQFVGSASDGEADPMTYAWTVVSSPAGSQATFSAANALQTDATFDKEGVYVLRLTATDSFGGSGYREVTITVVAAGSAFTVSYDGNGADSGAVPADANSPYAASSSVTVLGNTGSLVRSGFRFEGWGTSLSGGTLYQPGESFTISANTTLYAQWGAVTTNHSVPNVWLSARNPSWSSDYEAAALADHDGDGIPTWKEYWLGTDPLDPDSSFKIDSVTISGGNVTLRWNHAAVDASIPDIVIESSPDLSPGSWAELGTFAPVDGENTWSATLPDGDAFYRLSAQGVP